MWWLLVVAGSLWGVEGEQYQGSCADNLQDATGWMIPCHQWFFALLRFEWLPPCFRTSRHMPNEQVIQQGFVHMIFRSGPTQGEKRVADFIVKIGSNQYVFGAIGESGGEYLLAVEDGPT